MRLSKTVLIVMVLLALLVSFGAGNLTAQPTAQQGSDSRLTGFPDSTPYTDPVTGGFFPNSGKFINVTRGLASLGDVGEGQRVFNLSLAIPASLTAFELEVFDGDMGGKWDRLPTGTPDQLTFRLYADPLLTGASDVQLYPEWAATSMLDDDWCTLNESGDCEAGALITQHDAAYNEDEDTYYYHLIATWNTIDNTDEQNVFKVRVRGTPFLLAGSTIGFEGFGCNLEHPLCTPDFLWYSAYDGIFEFDFVVPVLGPPHPLGVIELYDGDFDLVPDTDDFNSLSDPSCRGAAADPDGPGPKVPDPLNGPWYTVLDPATGLPSCGFPPFQTSPDTWVEGANTGNPPDDQPWPLFLWEPDIWYEVIGPNNETAANHNVSGNQEWELFRIGLTGAPDEDATMSSLPAGAYRWRIQGVDALNTLFVHLKYNLLPSLPKLGNTVWFDKDRDGYWDATPEEPGIVGVVLNLYVDVDGDGQLDLDGRTPDQLIDSTSTGADGQYWFYDIPIGVVNTYWLVEVAPENFYAGGPLETLAPTIDRSTVAGDHYNRSSPWAVTMPPTNVDYIVADFGYVDQGDFCVWDPDDPDNGATGGWWINSDAEGNPQSVTIRTTLARTFADTAYGTNAHLTGWPGQGRRFKHIWTSDNLEMELLNGNGEVVMEFGIDLLERTDDPNFPSGFATAGVTGGDGYLAVGDLAHVLNYETSMSLNVNDSGCFDPTTSPEVTVDPETGEYTSEACPAWFWDTWYEITIDLAAFGDSGFGDAIVTTLHSSPSKTGEEKPDIDPCPPDWRDWL